MLSEEAIAKLEELLAPPDADGVALAGFRRDFPGLSLTRCDDSDVGVEEPFRRYPRFNVYLVDAADHCAHFTTDQSRATGLVVAAKAKVGV
jgi:hypothetical protein